MPQLSSALSPAMSSCVAVRGCGLPCAVHQCLCVNEREFIAMWLSVVPARCGGSRTGI